ncbi:MAG: hypothetical protein ACLPKB_17925 [Xanthobacteraceae bacterium]
MKRTTQATIFAVFTGELIFVATAVHADPPQAIEFTGGIIYLYESKSEDEQLNTKKITIYAKCDGQKTKSLVGELYLCRLDSSTVNGDDVFTLDYLTPITHTNGVTECAIKETMSTNLVKLCDNLARGSFSNGKKPKTE